MILYGVEDISSTEKKKENLRSVQQRWIKKKRVSNNSCRRGVKKIHRHKLLTIKNINYLKSLGLVVKNRG